MWFAFDPLRLNIMADITINADGSVSTETAPVTQAGNVYTLTSDVTGNIAVNRNNSVLDGNGYSVGSISLNDVTNVTAKNFTIAGGTELLSNAGIGILLSNTSNVIVANNTIEGVWSIYELNGVSYAGIDVEGGGSNIFTGNNLANNAIGIYFSETENNLVVGNNITG